MQNYDLLCAEVTDQIRVFTGYARKDIHWELCILPRVFIPALSVAIAPLLINKKRGEHDVSGLGLNAGIVLFLSTRPLELYHRGIWVTLGQCEQPTPAQHL